MKSLHTPAIGRGQTGGAFTLIEMLLVIAIIGILIVLVVPNIGKALKVSKRGKCQAHLREIGGVLSTYVMQSQYDIQYNTAFQRRDRQIYPSSNWKTDLLNYNSELQPSLSCPAAPMASSLSSYSGHPGIFGTQKDYKFIWAPSSLLVLADGTVGSNGDALSLASTLSSYVGTAASVATNPLPSTVYSRTDGTADGRLSLRHPGTRTPSFNALFADGHAQFLMEGELQNLNISTNKYVR